MLSTEDIQWILIADYISKHISENWICKLSCLITWDVKKYKYCINTFSFFLSSLLLCDFILPFCGHKSQWYTSFFLYFYNFVGGKKKTFTQLMWRKLSYFNTLQTLCVGVCFILMVTCRFDTIAPRHPLSPNKSPWQLKQTSLDTPATHTNSPVIAITTPSAFWCKHEGQKCSQRQPSTWIHVPYDHWRVWAQFCSACVCAAGGGDRWRPYFISGCDLVFYIIWYDDTGPIRGTGLCEKDDDYASGRLDWELTYERGRNSRRVGLVKEWKRRKRIGLRLGWRRAVGKIGRVMLVKEMKEEWEISMHVKSRGKNGINTKKLKKRQWGSTYFIQLHKYKYNKWACKTMVKRWVQL